MGRFTDWLFMRDDEGQTEGQTAGEGRAADESSVSDPLLSALVKNEAITREAAMTLPAVSGAVDFISNTIASMPVRLYKRKQGTVEEQDKDTRVKLLNGDTGDTLDAFQLKKAMVEDYLLDGNGYCYIERKRNDVVSLRYVEDRYIVAEPNFKPIFKDYVIYVEGGEYKPWDFVKLLRGTRDGATGTGLTQEVGKALEAAYGTLLYQLNLVSTGGNKKGFLKSQRKLGQDEINVLKAAWNRLYTNNTENVVVLNNGLEFQEASNSSVENQINESRKTLSDEINDLFHISDDFYLTFKLAIYPVMKAFETALNRDLLLEKEKKNYFFEFDPKEILRADIKERYEAYKLAKETGFMSYNEIRHAENLPYVEGLDVVNVGLGAVLYDFETHEYYTPNTDTASMLGTQKMLEGHVEAEEFDESGNSSARSEFDGETPVDDNAETIDALRG
jgi:HK97 family phage portal protein